MSKIIHRVKGKDYVREPQPFYAYFLRDGSIVERDGVRWRLHRPGYMWSGVDMLFGIAHYTWDVVS